MISWIQRYFQNHFKAIFAVLLAVTIISFIFTIGAGPGLGNAERRTAKREFFGYNLASAEDAQKINGDASLSVYLQLGYSGLPAEQVQAYALQRTTSLHIADQLHIPAANTAEITDSIKNLRIFAGQDGQFDAASYNKFRADIASRHGSEDDIARVISDDIRADKVQKLMGGPGYVLPADVAQELGKSDTSWTVGLAVADYASYNPNYTPSDAEVTKFFDENAFRYVVAPRVVASYVEFPALAYIGQVTVTDAEVRAFYDANPGRFPKAPAPAADPKAPAPAANPDADFAAVRPQVETALKLDRARRLAMKAADDFQFELYNSKIANGDALAAYLAKKQLVAKPLKPFTMQEGPEELGRNPEISEAAFKLNAERYFSEAQEGAVGGVVLLWKETNPARNQALVEVRAKVVADATENEKQKRFVALGRTIKSQLESHLKAGEAFDKAVASVASSVGMKIEAKTPAAFTARTAPADVDTSVRQSLERLSQGQVSDMVLAPDRGTFAYVIEKKAPDTTAANPRSAELQKQLAAFSARSTGGAILSELRDTELKRSEPAKN